MKTKSTLQKPAEFEELPDAWERFERAFDTVMRAKPKSASSKAYEPSPARGGNRGGKESA